MEVKDFLLNTQILPQLNGGLCQAVTNQPDAGVMLEKVYHRNLFLVGTDSQHGYESIASFNRWHPNHSIPQLTFHYHDLFAEFLRHKLQQTQPELVPELHLRAARAESDLSRAVNHYLAAERWLEAAEIIERIGGEMFTQGYLDTLNRWIYSLLNANRFTASACLYFLDWRSSQQSPDNNYLGQNVHNREARLYRWGNSIRYVIRLS